ncbi:hypothetical protein ACPCA8_08980 [Streptomyces capoamus]|uniref:hypothetical protein n=1 Tax=Streptomyces capoamus TaxID=68183 RepID=UPI003C2EFA16
MEAVPDDRCTEGLQLLPARRQAITRAGITIRHRTYDADLLAPAEMGDPLQPARDVRQIWIRLTDSELTELPWIHRDHEPTTPQADKYWTHQQTHSQRQSTACPDQVGQGQSLAAPGTFPAPEEGAAGSARQSDSERPQAAS